MCWSPTVTAAMIGLGAIATAVTIRRGEPSAIPLALGYFTLMEGLQFAGLMVIDQCGSPENRTVTFLSFLHIAFQPLIINAFAMQLVPEGVRRRASLAVYGVCAFSTIVMLLQIYPFEWAGSCRPGSTLCGPALCTVSGSWHLAWDVPYNGLFNWAEDATGLMWGFPTYVIAVFLLPLFYGAWRFVLFHALAGPFLASYYLTDNPNEVPAIWCLFSVGILLMGLSPLIRRQFEWRPSMA